MMYNDAVYLLRLNPFGILFPRFILVYVLSYKNNDITYQCCNTEQGVYEKKEYCFVFAPHKNITQGKS